MSVQEHLHDFQPPVERCQVQGCLELVVAHGGVGQLLQQHLHHLRVAVLRGAVQRRLVVVVLGGEKCQRVTTGRAEPLRASLKPLKFKCKKQDKTSSEPGLIQLRVVFPSCH